MSDSSDSELDIVGDTARANAARLGQAVVDLIDRTGPPQDRSAFRRVMQGFLDQQSDID